MENQDNQNSNIFISLAEASKETGYHQDYLGFLCRNGKLKGMKIGRNWVTTKSALEEFKNTYKNEISEVADESGNEIKVHIQKTEKPVEVFPGIEQNILPAPSGLVGQNQFEKKFDTEISNLNNSVQPLLAGLKKDVLENIEQRVKNISSSIENLEKKIHTQEIETTKISEVVPENLNQEFQNESFSVPTPFNIKQNFVSNFDFFNQEKSEKKSTNTNSVVGLFSQKNVDQLYRSFKVKPKFNSVAIALTGLVAVIGFVSSLVWSGVFSGNQMLSEVNKNPNIVQQNIIVKNLQSENVNQPQAGGITIRERVTTQNITNVLGPDTNQIASVVTQTLEKYLAEGKFKGEKGETGASGTGGIPVSYVQPSSSNNNAGGSIAGITYLSSSNFGTNNATVSNLLTVSGTSNFTGSVTMSGPNTLNGTTTIANLSVTNINPNFTEGSIAFQGVNGLTQDNSNLFFNSSTTQLSVGTNTPVASAILQLESTNKGFLAPRMTEVQRDAIASPSAGLFLYNTTSNQYNIYNGSAWTVVGTGSGSGSIATGTPGAFSYYTAADTNLYPQSVLYYSGGKIGIGTSSPVATLTVMGTSSAPTVNPLVVASSSGAQLFTILPNGNVGIGTSTPAQALSVVGNMQLTGSLFDSTNASGTSGQILSSTGTGTQWISTSTLVGGNALVSLNGQTGSSQSFATSTSGGLQLNITSSGNVHTFALQPASGYNVPLTASTTEWSSFYNTPSSRISLANNLAWTGNTLGVTSGYNIPLTASTTNWNNFFNTPSTQITAGTGLSWSGNTLQASNAFTGSGINGYSARWASSTGLTTGILLDNGTVAGVNATSSSYTFNIQGASGTNPFNISSSTGTSLLTVLQNGNVGIGTSSASQLLTVGNNNQFTVSSSGAIVGVSLSINSRASIGVNGANAGNIVLTDNFSNTYSYNGSGIGFRSDSQNLGNINAVISNGANLGFTFRAGGTDLAIINYDKTIGLGTTTQIASLNFQGASTTLPILNIASSTGLSVLRINSNGNVGINTSTPSQTLSVQGQAGVNPFNITSSTGTTLLTVLANGSVGVGVSNPSATLDVNGSIRLNNNPLYIRGSGDTLHYLVYGSAVDGPSLAGYNGGELSTTINNNWSLRWNGSSQVFARNTLSVGTTTPSVATLFVQGTSTAGALNVFSVASSTGTSLFTVLANGSVGIGTTTPAQKLSIAGNIQLTGSLFDASNASGTSGQILSSTGTGTQWISTSTLVGGNALVSLNGQTGSSQTFATSTSGGIDLNITSSGNIHTFALQPASGYNIPLTASTTNWNNFFNTPSTQITAGTGLSWSGNTLQASNAFTGSGVNGYSARWASSTGLTTGILLDNGTVAGVNATSSSYTFNIQGASGTNPFNISSSTGSSLFTVLANGNVGIGTSAPAHALDVVGSIQNLAASSSILTRLGSLTFGNGESGANGITVVGKYAYVSHDNSPGRYSIVDVSNPASPQQVGVYTFNTGENNIATTEVAGKYAYVSVFNNYSSPAKLVILDISNPAVPVRMGSIALSSVGNTPAFKLALYGKYVYMQTDSSPTRLIAIDVSDPMNPKEANTLTFTSGQNGGRYGLVVSGKYAFLSDDNTPGNIYSVDISNPASPVRVSSLAFSTGEEIHNIVLQGRYLYVTTWTSPAKIVIVDISNPANMTRVNTLTLNSGESLGLNFKISGRYGFVTTFTSPSQVVMIDISSTTSPRRIGAISGNSGENNFRGLAVAGRYVYAGSQTSPGNFIVYDMSGTETTSLIAHSAEIGNLQVSQNIILGGSAIIQNSLQVGSGGIQSNGALAVSSTSTISTFGGQLTIGTTSTSSMVSIQAQAGVNPFNISSSTGTSLLTVLQNGNVGIGTTTPGAKLDVYGSANIGTNLASYITLSGSASTPAISSAGSSADIDLAFNPKGNGQTIFGGGGYTYNTQASGKASILFNNGSSDTPNLKFVYGNNVNFGIDSAGSGAFGGLATQFLRFIRNSDEGSGLVIAGIDASGNAAFNGTGYFGGNVGIGTTTLSQTLSVAGNMRLTGSLFDSTNASGTTGMLLSSTGTGTAWIATSTLGITSASGTVGNIQFAGVGNTLNATELFNWDNTNLKLSVGTTSTSSTFTLQGQAGASPLLTIASSSGSSVLTVLASGNFGFNVQPTAAVNPNNRLYTFGTQTTNGSVELMLSPSGVGSALFGTTGNLPLYFTTNGTIRMTILGGTTPNVGIGTSTPTHTLSIQGTGSSNLLNISSSTGTSILEVLANNSVRIGINASSTVSTNTASTTPVLQLGPTALYSPSSGGTYLGINAMNKAFQGNFIEFQNNYNSYTNATTSVFKVDANGAITINTSAYNTSPLSIYPGRGGFNDTNVGLFEGTSFTGMSGTVPAFKFRAALANAGTAITDNSSFFKLEPWFSMFQATSSPSYTILEISPSIVSGGSGGQNNILGSWTGANISPTFGGGTDKFTGTSTVVSLKVAPIINMATTSTVGYFGLLVNPQETSTSSTATNYVASFQRNGNRYLDITSTGRIGIGTSTPIATLTVMGTSSAPTVNPFTVASSSGTTLLTVLANGNVGIGTNNPTSPFTVSVSAPNSGLIKLQNTSSSNSYASLDLYNTSGSQTGGFGYGNTSASAYTDKVYYYSIGKDLVLGHSAGGIDLTINGSTGNVTLAQNLTVSGVGNSSFAGKVGIGTTTPVQVLSVAGNMQLTGSLFDTNNASGTLGMILQTTGTGTQWVATSTLGISGGSGTVGAGLTGEIPYYTGNGTTIAGTTTLQFYSGNLRIGGQYGISNGANAELLGASTAVSVNGDIGIAGSSAVVRKIVVGKGFGDTDGSSLLIKAGDSGVVDFGDGSYLGGDLILNAGLSDNYPTYRHGNVLIATSTGNVGIGTTTPSQKLSVAGNMRLTGSLFDANNASGTLGMLLQSTGTGTQWVATSTLGISAGASASGTAGNIQFAGAGNTLNANQLFNWDNTNLKLSVGTTSTSSTFTLQGQAGTSPLLTIASSSGTSLLTVLANGNVGIGTSSPGQLLQVAGSLGIGSANNITGTLVFYSTGTSTNVTIRATTSLASSYTLSLPALAPQDGQSLITDANGNLRWGGFDPMDMSVYYRDISLAAGKYAPGSEFQYTGSCSAGSYSDDATGTPGSTSWTGNNCNVFYPQSQLPLKDFISGSSPLKYQLVIRGARGGGLGAGDVYFGWSNSTAIASTTFVGLRYKTSLSAWQCVIRSNDVDVATSTVVSTSDTSYHTFRVYNNGVANSVTCDVDSNTSTTVGTVPASDWFAVAGASTANQSYKLQQIKMLIRGITSRGIYSDTLAARGGADLAERYPTTDGSLEPGNVVMADVGFPVFVSKATSTTKSILGIISTSPGITLADERSFSSKASSTVAVALAGRVPVKVSNENGNIEIGDYLTVSKQFAGYAMKATVSGQVVGQALESFSEATSSKGSVLVFLQVGYQNVNNTFVLGENDGQLSTATSTPGVVANSFLINQKGSGNLLQLQQNGEDRFLVGNNGSVNIFALSSSTSEIILNVQNGTTSLFTINAVGDITTKGHITVGKDTAGTATIKAGDDQVVVSFSAPYLSVPKVVVSVQGLPDFYYGVATKTLESFVIKISKPATADITFDWVALAQPEDTDSVSGQSQIQVVELQTPPPIVPEPDIIPSTGGEVAGTSTPPFSPAPEAAPVNPQPEIAPTPPAPVVLEPAP